MSAIIAVRSAATRCSSSAIRIRDGRSGMDSGRVKFRGAVGFIVCPFMNHLGKTWNRSREAMLSNGAVPAARDLLTRGNPVQEPCKTSKQDPILEGSSAVQGVNLVLFQIMPATPVRSSGRTGRRAQPELR